MRRHVVPIRTSFVVALLVLLSASAASANAGVPMLAVVWPLLGILIVPIVAAESILIRRALAIPPRRALGASLAANLFSAVVGVPLTWVALVALQILTGGGAARGIGSPLQRVLAVTWQSPWLIPYEDHLSWMVPAACMSLMVPFFVASVWAEGLVCVRWLRERERGEVRAAVLRANLASYSVLLLAAAVWTMVELRAAA